MTKRFVLGLAGLALVLSACGSDDESAAEKPESTTSEAGPATADEVAFLEQVHSAALGSSMPDETALEVGYKMCDTLDEPGVGVGEMMLRGGIPQTHLFHVEAAVEHLCPEHMDKWDSAMASKDR